MTRLLLISLFSFLIYSKNTHRSSCVQTSVDSIFTDWNRSTFLSFKRQIQNTENKRQKDAYENRKAALLAYLDITNADFVNTNSIRYKFIEKLASINKERKLNVSIIEANSSGSKILLRTFVLYEDSAGSTKIDFYINVNGKWVKQGGCNKKVTFLKENLENYITKENLGLNYEDIIVTKIIDNIVRESEFYLGGTLSAKSGIKDVLDCYRTDNFISIK